MPLPGNPFRAAHNFSRITRALGFRYIVTGAVQHVGIRTDALENFVSDKRSRRIGGALSLHTCNRIFEVHPRLCAGNGWRKLLNDDDDETRMVCTT